MFPVNKNFSKFYRSRKKKPDGVNASSVFKTYTLEQIEELGLTLKDGIESLPEQMQANLKKAGVTTLFPVQ